MAGVGGDEERVVPQLRRPVPAGVACAYAEACTAPGEAVLLPYCQGAGEVREILAAGRRAFAVSFDPLLVLLAKAALSPPPARELDAAVARLGDSLKHGVPLRRYLSDLYATTCPACQRAVVAEAFVWDRDQGVPLEKQVRCPACDWNGLTGADAEDRERLAKIPVRGMHYHYVLDRIVPPDQEESGPPRRTGPARGRLETGLKFYSPRNLYALAELTLKVDGLYPAGPVHDALKAVLLDCLDRCSFLPSPPATDKAGAAVAGSAARHLYREQLPHRPVERNVWLAFEEAVVRFQAAGRAAPGLALAASAAELLPAFGGEGRVRAAPPWQGQGPVPPVVGRAGASPPSGGGSAAPGYVGQMSVRDLGRALPVRSVGLVLFSPPLLDSALWMTSYLWGSWLLGSEVTGPLRPLLRERPAQAGRPGAPDLAWYAEAMGGSLRVLGDLLRKDGCLVMVVTGQQPALLEALLAAAASARLRVQALAQCGADYRLQLAPALPPAATSGGRPFSAQRPPLETEVGEAARAAAVDVLQVRGEPTPWRPLHAAVQRRLAEAGLWSRLVDPAEKAASPLSLAAEQVLEGLQDPALVRLEGTEDDEPTWWLAEAGMPGSQGAPLCDRVETAVLEILAGATACSEDWVRQAAFERFPGALTPEAELVATCLRSWGEADGEGGWRLRREDEQGAREAEAESVAGQLMSLGRRLGYRTAACLPWTSAGQGPPFDVAWRQQSGGPVAAAFAVRWLAALGEVLALGEWLALGRGGAQLYLVIPGGRSALLSYKLAHNPLWRQAVTQGGWRFIKYRHVRELLAQPDVDEYALRAIVGLDPPVERETVQLALF